MPLKRLSKVVKVLWVWLLIIFGLSVDSALFVIASIRRKD